MGIESMLMAGVMGLAGLTIAIAAALRGWQGWLEVKKMEVAQNFQGINPGFEVTGLVPKQPCTLAYGRQKLPGTIGPRKFHRSRRRFRKH